MGWCLASEVSLTAPSRDPVPLGVGTIAVGKFMPRPGSRHVLDVLLEQNTDEKSTAVVAIDSVIPHWCCITTLRMEPGGLVSRPAIVSVKEGVAGEIVSSGTTKKPLTAIEVEGAHGASPHQLQALASH